MIVTRKEAIILPNNAAGQAYARRLEKAHRSHLLDSRVVGDEIKLLFGHTDNEYPFREENTERSTYHGFY